MSNDSEEWLSLIDMATYCDREGIDYREEYGASGEQLNLRECPVCHQDKWKVYLNAETGLGNCFSGSCQATFNKFTFIRAHLGASNRDTFRHIEQVAKELGWRSRFIKPKPVQTEQPELALPPTYAIPIQGRNLRYLAERHVDSGTARYFHLRYCHQGKATFDLGGRQRSHDFSKRVIIPIFDLDGNMVSYQGRDITGTAERKYLFPPGFASTGRYLYNGHNARGATRVVVGEGAFDAIALKAALDEEMDLRDIVPVGTFTNKITTGHPDGDDQLGVFRQLYREGLREVTLMWDGEDFTLKNAGAAAETLKRIGIHVRIAVLPADRDPADLPFSQVRQHYWQAINATAQNLVRIKMGVVKPAS